MIGDDQIDAQPSSCLRGSEGANAHVHADDQLDACRRGALDDVITHVVAVAYAVRNMKVGGASA